jgi:hypothetical protein
MMQNWADFLDETLRTGVYKLIPPSYRECEERANDERKPAEKERSAKNRRTANLNK